eukprot:m.144246 g.144246  ORF g.144246 m.144246 type:complete len:50 (-) comp16038_c0_seq7:168-317(-)
MNRMKLQRTLENAAKLEEKEQQRRLAQDPDDNEFRKRMIDPFFSPPNIT